MQLIKSVKRDFLKDQRTEKMYIKEENRKFARRAEEQVNRQTYEEMEKKKEKTAKRWAYSNKQKWF